MNIRILHYPVVLLLVVTACTPARQYVNVDDDVYYTRKDAAREREAYLQRVQQSSTPVMKSSDYMIPGQSSADSIWSDTNTEIPVQRSYFVDEEEWIAGQDPWAVTPQFPSQIGWNMNCPFGCQPGPMWTPGWRMGIGFHFGNPSPFFGNRWGNQWGNAWGDPFWFGNPYYDPFWNNGWGYPGGYLYPSPFYPMYGYGYNPYFGSVYTPGVILYDNTPPAVRTPRTQGNRSIPGKVYQGGRGRVPVAPNRRVPPRKEVPVQAPGNEAAPVRLSPVDAPRQVNPVVQPQPGNPAPVPHVPSHQQHRNAPVVAPQQPIPASGVQPEKSRKERRLERFREWQQKQQEHQQRQPQRFERTPQQRQPQPQQRVTPQQRPVPRQAPAPGRGGQSPAPRPGRSR
jgi:hypothetical protein